ncbi:MAG TPA: glycerol-3-phosphate acyltransferase [Ornithinibacter sp.]|jgi:glycerol-3-phosphate acyltransferase PlsY|nr:glycerol-3-phosphate acyltransferase [Dermatophilaceae bacterium]MBU9943685.1 glycerol-3-phosphate acyltransferase [Dermatophilaceae bacterium]HQW73643.1 glycerol-3-phosphate acyltransferase [Ornithinibacter sp.]HQX87213.1 glycerol-3-phosphate acyltransferase [Ornithinibacter sp.]
MGTSVIQLCGVAALCFLVGSINPATILARALGRDLRSSGSGNPGATNAARVLGPRWGVVVLLLDVAKAWLPSLLVLRTMGTLAAIVAGTAVVLGHMFSPFLRGKGGKGVASALGALLAIAPGVALGAVVVFVLAKTVLPFVGEASVVTMLVVATVGVAGAAGVVPGVSQLVGGWLIVLPLLVLSRHQRNIRAWLMRRKHRRAAPGS